MAPRTELFVKQASAYARARPVYPATLFEMLAAATKKHELAWDCATGNGQAASMLSEHFKSVVATDISDGQLAHAIPRPNVKYAKMPATPAPEELERIVGPDGSVDLVTVAQALHWFDLEKFYAVVKRVLRKPGGVLAAWCCLLPRVSPEVDELCDRFYRVDSGPYWDQEVIKIVDAEYTTLPFPFEPVDERGIGPHKLSMTTEWNLEDYMTFWRSCSAVQTALDQGIDLLTDEVKDGFAKAWGPADQMRTVTFPIALMLGREVFPCIPVSASPGREKTQHCDQDWNPMGELTEVNSKEKGTLVIPSLITEPCFSSFANMLMYKKD
ncbi:hypothetical protein R1sor_009681 [Riccia sorocarpa]|uniref:Methyltransferase type 11 domain-containing protein n=1 Tax=Riccia sorocarpa TaxID=122646 RepID=A0ABD3HZB2_9MARC